MADKVEIEGTPEREADRGRVMDHAGMAVGENSLGNPETAKQLIYGFLSAVNDTNTAFIAGKIDGAAAQEQVVRLADNLADTFLGKNAAYQGDAWFSDDGLGAAMASAAGSGFDPGQATAAFALGLADQLLALGSRFQADEVTEDDIQFQIDAIAENGLQGFLGLPTEDDA